MSLCRRILLPVRTPSGLNVVEKSSHRAWNGQHCCGYTNSGSGAYPHKVEQPRTRNRHLCCHMNWSVGFERTLEKARLDVGKISRWVCELPISFVSVWHPCQHSRPQLWLQAPTGHGHKPTTPTKPWNDRAGQGRSNATVVILQSIDTGLFAIIQSVGPSYPLHTSTLAWVTCGVKADQDPAKRVDRSASNSLCRPLIQEYHNSFAFSLS